MSEEYVVKQGDCLIRIAANSGFRDWKTIYEHEKNAEFRQKRPDPNIIFPGDCIFIPKKKDKSVPLGIGQQHRITVKTPRTMLRLEVQGEDGEPLAGKPFELKLGNKSFQGSTSSDGVVEQAILRTSMSRDTAELTVYLTDDKQGAHYFWNLFIGHLDPIEEVSGVQQRLNNLGFYCGEADGKVEGEMFQLALRGFQAFAKLAITGIIDDDTRKKLVAMHGKV